MHTVQCDQCAFLERSSSAAHAPHARRVLLLIPLRCFLTYFKAMFPPLARLHFRATYSTASFLLRTNSLPRPASLYRFQIFTFLPSFFPPPSFLSSSLVVVCFPHRLYQLCSPRALFAIFRHCLLPRIVVAAQFLLRSIHNCVSAGPGSSRVYSLGIWCVGVVKEKSIATIRQLPSRSFYPGSCQDGFQLQKDRQ